MRALLLDLGCTDDEIDRAVSDDVLDLLVVDRLVVPSPRRLTEEDVTARTGVPVETTRRLRRALGFLDVGEHEAFFTEMDVEAVQLFRSMVELGQVDEDTAVQMARVIGSSMARIAEAETWPGTTPMLMGSGDSVLDADGFARGAGDSLPAMARLLEYVWRRHLQAASRRAMLLRTRHEEGISPVQAVGFADMVGFTMLSQHLEEQELAALVARFEVLAHDTVVGLGGRVVKMIGDEVMFTVQDATPAAEIGLSLAEAYADDDLLSDVRVALAMGPVLIQDGDYYGPVVNLANRLVGMAKPGTVLISDEFRAALLDGEDAASGLDTRALRVRTLRDFGRVQVWKLTRSGANREAEHGRGFRWERIESVLHDLEVLRNQGQQALARNPQRVAGSGPRAGSVRIEAEGGDPERTQVEAGREGGEGTTA